MNLSMKKFVLPLAALFAAVSPATAQFIFVGDSELGFLDYSNYYKYPTNMINISGYSHDGHTAFYSDSAFAQATELPGFDYKYPWMGIGEYSGAENGMSPLEISLPSTNNKDMGGWYSGQRMQTVFSFGGGRNLTISLGSKDSADSGVTYYTAAFKVCLENADSSVSVVRAADAAQKTFTFNADNPVTIVGGTANFGTLETGALDLMKTSDIIVSGGAVLNSYVKKIEANAGTSERNITVKGLLNFRVAEIAGGSALITATGSCSTQGGMINFDFTDFDLSEGVYDLISAGGGFSLNGSPDDLSMDFGIIGLSPEKFNLAISSDGTLLQLAVVPEPAAAAILSAALALALTISRRRK